MKVPLFKTKNIDVIPERISAFGKGNELVNTYTDRITGNI
ncbi:MAG: hypothetical protein PWQ20_131 [Thermotogaceae bacterium]|jgi:hypothetical protein|nr:hypothetical protein [Thermotogaceae bacterium]MDN5337061.1 hypothetical protein [Thermotogaceae bacterium]